MHPHGLCFPCPGGHLCWEHQEAQTAGRSLGSMSWLVSHGCISLQVSKMQIKSLLGFWEMTNSERKSGCQHRGGQPAGELGLLHKLLRKILCFSSVKSRGFSETQERGRAITAHLVAHGSAKSHSVESTQNGCSCSSVAFGSCVQRKKVEDAGFCTILANPADSYPPLLSEQGPGS